MQDPLLPCVSLMRWNRVTTSTAFLLRDRAWTGVVLSDFHELMTSELFLLSLCERATVPWSERISREAWVYYLQLHPQSLQMSLYTLWL